MNLYGWCVEVLGGDHQRIVVNHRVVILAQLEMGCSRSRRHADKRPNLVTNHSTRSTTTDYIHKVGCRIGLPVDVAVLNLAVIYLSIQQNIIKRILFTVEVDNLGIGKDHYIPIEPILP